MTVPRVKIPTLEQIARHQDTQIFTPSNPADPFEPFEIHDIHGLRKAVVPVFNQNIAGEIEGAGTAFHADSFGNMISASHVFINTKHSKELKSDSQDSIRLVPTKHRQLVYLGHGYIFFGDSGPLPDGSLLAVDEVNGLCIRGDNPIKSLCGKVDVEMMDVAALVLENHPKENFHANLPIRLNGWRPRKSEWVFAVGYPDIPAENIPRAKVSILGQEKMVGAFGKIRAAHPRGRGVNHPTPVIEIESRWLFGMSGGPVFNMQGEVIGVVSSSSYPDHDDAFAGCFEFIPKMTTFIPSLLHDNPTWREGWGAWNEKKKSIEGFFPNERSARDFAIERGPDFKAQSIQRRIGTDEYMVLN